MLSRLSGLGRNLLIYGLGDVATSVISFFLLPVYVRYLSPEDYGVIGLLLTVEVVTKILFRWGVDAAFMRLYFDCPDHAARQRLASTLFFFLLALNGSLLLVGLAAAPQLATWLFGSSHHVAPLRLVFLSTFLVGFYFLPFHVLRIRGRSPEFIALTIARSLAIILLRLLLVVGFRQGVLGVVVADLAVNIVFTVALSRWFLPLLRPVFSRAVLREALGFGLPRLPHGVGHQAIAVADRLILAQYVTLREIGLYSIGATFGLTMKLFLSAFENAWAPFYFGTMREPDARRTFSLVTTYGVAVLVLLVAGLSAIARDVVELMTLPEFSGAAAVIPWIGIGVLFQGVYLLTSIGLNITKQTTYYPVATGCAAVTSLAANFLLIPRFGAMGAAWANALSYAVLAGVGFSLSQRFYPMSYEWGRLLRVVIAGLGAYLLSQVLIPLRVPPLLGLLARGTLVVAAFAALLVLTGFYQRNEVALLGRVVSRLRRGRTAPAEPATQTTELAGELVSTTVTEAPDGTGRDSRP